MQLELLKQKAVEQVGRLRGTPFKDRIQDYKSTIKFLDRINPNSPLALDFALRKYEILLRDISATLELVAIYDMLSKSSTTMRIGDQTKTLLFDLTELVVRTEAMEYVRSHGHGKLFVPHKISGSFTNAGAIVRSGEIDIGLSVEPEGCAYAYFFEAHGLPVLHVFADFDDHGGIDYRETEDLTRLSGRRVLLIEDDVRTGKTLKAVLAHIEHFGILELQLFLGNLDQFQNINAVPTRIAKVHSNNGQSSIGEQGLADDEFVAFFSGLCDRYQVFRNPPK
ncbi:Uncharacterised protein [Candidatus Bilamarchaeum dharawalense]|uniref:Phosphoribosyltransferase domain-containing protein n=1 Tax=Candidatus Bilamarchaeum dharawalense TaxID=2885759 RepID=A0A5E4LRQ0_9ARCH|nr:Uncharacterised protein [Candidatus Bilamarchaeum dharawalense]